MKIAHDYSQAEQKLNWGGLMFKILHKKRQWRSKQAGEVKDCRH
jgi:hypothetical protein